MRPAGIDAKAWLAGEAALLKRLNGVQRALVAAAAGVAAPKTIGADPEGLDIMVGPRRVRVDFGAAARTPRGVPGALKRLS